jgi:hypothetical protein
MEATMSDNPKTTLRFNDCTLAKLDNTFALQQVDDLPALQNWLGRAADITAFEREALQFYQHGLRRSVHDWNEQELDMHFIGPVFSLVNFIADRFNLFAVRPLAGVV